MAKSKQVSGWVGWIGFASFMLMLAGSFHLIAGIVALFKNEVYVAGAKNVWILDYTQWGWIHILGGILAIGAAGSLAQGKLYGRTFAVLVALASAIANMAFVPVYPIWSIMIVTINILVIWAVIVHGDEVRE